MLEQKLEEYAEQFEENFPIFLFRGASDDFIIQKIDECLENGEPLDEDTDINDDY